MKSLNSVACIHTLSLFRQILLGTLSRGYKRKEKATIKFKSPSIIATWEVFQFCLWARFSYCIAIILFSGDQGDNIFVHAGTLDQMIAERLF